VLVACEFWQQWLDTADTPPSTEVSAVQERIVLAQRLHTLLHP
jgi:hypothetical protein